MNLLNTLNAALDLNGENFFKDKGSNNFTQNLNPAFELRDYQKEAIGRLIYYLNEYPKKMRPASLLFHMATGSGKTLVMSAAILHLYEQGYRNFVFFVNSTNIINKTRDNFLESYSTKYLFNERIKFGEKEVLIKEVDNFESANQEDINIVFTTIQGLHSRLNMPRENSITYEDFENKKIVLISDEAHHINALTKNNKLNKTEEEEKSSWEYTVLKILNSHKENILLEFTATIDLNDENIKTKYDDKIIYQYDLKQFRNDRYSKEIEVLQADLSQIERALQAVLLSQYRRKIAERSGLHCKPVILMKSKDIKSSQSFEIEFYEAIEKLNEKDLQKIQKVENRTIQKVFTFFEDNQVSLANLCLEIKEDFAENKCLSVNSQNDSEEKQLIVNSLEDFDNETRVVFAVDKLNEGWDILNLFDIVRLYDTRDAQGNKPGKTTMAEAQLIGRGARYFPFKIEESQEKFKRKFDEDIANDLRILEQLYYHSAHNPKYIQELNTALVQIGIKADKTIEREIKIKDKFKESYFWKKGHIYLNKREANGCKNVFSLEDANIKKSYEVRLFTGAIKEDEILSDKNNSKIEENKTSKKDIYLKEISKSIIRSAINKLDFYRFSNLQKYFPHLKTITEFIESDKYLAKLELSLIGKNIDLNALNRLQLLESILHILEKIAEEIKANTPEFTGTKEFKPNTINKIFKDKILKLDGDSPRAREMENFDFSAREWFAQSEIYGTSEEESFMRFMDDAIRKLNAKYDDICLFRNERFFGIYNFKDGKKFEPDFVLFLREKDTKEQLIYQLFIEPKGDHLVNNENEKWKEEFLLEIEKDNQIIVKFENNDYKLVGLPFYNKASENEFKEAFERFT